MWPTFCNGLSPNHAANAPADTRPSAEAGLKWLHWLMDLA